MQSSFGWCRYFLCVFLLFLLLLQLHLVHEILQYQLQHFMFNKLPSNLIHWNSFRMEQQNKKLKSKCALIHHTGIWLQKYIILLSLTHKNAHTIYYIQITRAEVSFYRKCEMQNSANAVKLRTNYYDGLTSNQFYSFDRIQMLSNHYDLRICPNSIEYCDVCRFGLSIHKLNVNNLSCRKISNFISSI